MVSPASLIGVHDVSGWGVGDAFKIDSVSREMKISLTVSSHSLTMGGITGLIAQEMSS